MKPSLFGTIDCRLRQVTGNNDIQFGGISISMFGDFNQLPLLKAQILPDAFVLFALQDVGIERIA